MNNLNQIIIEGTVTWKADPLIDPWYFEIEVVLGKDRTMVIHVLPSDDLAAAVKAGIVKGRDVRVIGRLDYKDEDTDWYVIVAEHIIFKPACAEEDTMDNHQLDIDHFAAAILLAGKSNAVHGPEAERLLTASDRELEKIEAPHD